MPLEVVRDKIAQALKIDWVVPLSAEIWEDRIVPLLAELEGSSGVKKIVLQSGEDRVLYVGNAPAVIPHVFPRAEESEGDPKFFLYVFDRIADLTLLRRLKDFPDETPRQELESSWIGECPTLKSLIVINPGKVLSLHG